MKKIIACMSLVFALSAGATALATDVTDAYTKDGNSLSVSLSGATNMNTILITKDADILFADQNDDTFSGVTSFLLKGESLDPGTYTVKMNTANGGSATESTFTISDEPLTDMAIETEAFTYAKKAQGKDVYDIGFKAENANIKNIRYIAVTRSSDSKTAYYDIGSTITSGTANIAIRINNIPATDTVSVRLVAEKPAIPSGN